MFGHDVDRAAAGDRADVDRRLLVQAPERHRGDRAGGGEDRAAPVLGADARVRGGAAEARLHAEVASASRAITSPIGEAWSNTKPKLAAQRGGVERAARPPASVSSPTVNSSSTSTGAPSLARCAARAPAAPRRRPCCRRRGCPRWRSPSRRRSSTGSTGACSGTVSRCAHSSTRARAAGRLAAAGRAAGAGNPREQVAAVRADQRAGAVLVDARRRARAARRSPARRSARSRPEGLSIRHSSANVPFR